MRIVVTRPLEQAAATAARLRERGHEAIILPLTEVVARPTQDIDESEIESVAVTSANALRHLERGLLQRIRHIPLFAVGDRTADQALAAGFEQVASAQGDVGALAALALKKSRQGSRILYCCGRPRRPEFERLMEAAGRAVTLAETYETRQLAVESSALVHADVVLVYAQSAAAALNKMNISVSDATFICISERVARTLRAPAQNVRLIAHPDENSMLAEIDRLP